MTDKKRKLIGNGLVFALIFVALAVYCRPIPLTRLLDIPEGEVSEGYVTYPVFQNEPPLGIDMFLVTTYAENETPVPKETWDAWIASIRVRRGPLNWLGNLYPSGGVTDLEEPWALYLTKADGSHLGSLHSYDGSRFGYTTPKLDRYLPCYVQNADEVCAQAMTLLDQYGKQQ